MTAETLHQYFERLFLDYGDAIFRHLLYRLGDRERAKELTQEVFMRTWQYLARGQKLAHPKAFLYQVANRLFINEIRTDRTTYSLDAAMETQGYDTPAPDKLPDVVASEAELLRYLAKLAPADRDVLVMRYLDDMTVKEIAALQDEKETTVSMRIARALTRLRELYEHPTKL